MSSAIRLWMIHGNLQTPKVWQPIPTQLQQAFPSAHLSITLENIWESPAQSLAEWAALFCQRVATRPPHILLGYSLGGRLAFHALIHQPDLWQGAIIISADPGVGTADRQACLTRDQNWSQKFLHQPWQELLREWNALPVFCGRKPAYPILEADFSRTQIAAAFQNFSKGHQADLLPHLQNLNLPVLYISGAEDRKYCHIGQRLSQHCPTVTHQIIPNAGHRVPWENPDAFLLAVCQFLDQDWS